MGVTAGEAMDRLVHDGVLTEDDVRKYRLMLAAEDDEAAKVLVEYEREGPNPAAIESFQKRALPILERARSLEKELQSEGKMISPVPTPLEIPTAEAIDVRQPGSPYNSSHTVQNIVNGLAAAAFADKNAGGGVRKRRVSHYLALASTNKELTYQFPLVCRLCWWQTAASIQYTSRTCVDSTWLESSWRAGVMCVL